MSLNNGGGLVAEGYARALLSDAVAIAFDELAFEGYRREDLHQTAVCARLADITVKNLAQFNVGNAEHERHVASDLTRHDYPKISTTSGDIVADGTWQQFLPIAFRSARLPKVLIGTRNEVAQAASSFGVPKEKLDLWSDKSKTDLEAERLADLAAEADAEEIDELGKWELFMSSPSTFD